MTGTRMLRDGYPQILLPQDWVRTTAGELPTIENSIALAQWVSEQDDTLIVYQNEDPNRARERFSVVWKPPNGTPKRTIHASSFPLTGKHVSRVFERAHARDLE